MASEFLTDRYPSSFGTPLLRVFKMSRVCLSHFFFTCTCFRQSIFPPGIPQSFSRFSFDGKIQHFLDDRWSVSVITRRRNSTPCRGFASCLSSLVERSRRTPARLLVVGVCRHRYVCSHFLRRVVSFRYVKLSRSVSPLCVRGDSHRRRHQSLASEWKKK